MVAKIFLSKHVREKSFKVLENPSLAHPNRVLWLALVVVASDNSCFLVSSASSLLTSRVSSLLVCLLSLLLVSGKNYKRKAIVSKKLLFIYGVMEIAETLIYWATTLFILYNLYFPFSNA